jgi:hypothetical protein
MNKFDRWEIDEIIKKGDETWIITIYNKDTGEIRQLQRSKNWLINRVWGKFKSF